MKPTAKNGNIRSEQHNEIENWTDESAFLQEAIILRNAQDIHELASVIRNSYEKAKSVNQTPEEAFQKTIIRMVAYLSSRTMRKNIYDSGVRGSYGPLEVIKSGARKLKNVWNTEVENRKTFKKLQHPHQSDHALVCIDAARFISSILDISSIPSQIAVLQGKKLPHAFNVIKNPDTHTYYAVTTDAVGQFPKVIYAISVPLLLEQLESWQLINSRAQGTQSIVLLDTHGNKTGSYETLAQNILSNQGEQEGTHIAGIRTPLQNTIINITHTGTQTNGKIGPIHITTTKEYHGTRIIPPEKGPYKLHPQDTKYSTGTGIIARCSQKIGIILEMPHHILGYGDITLGENIVIDKKGTSIPHLHVSNKVGLQKSGTKQTNRYHIDAYLAGTSTEYTTLQALGYRGDHFGITGQISYPIQKVTLEIKIRIKNTGAYSITGKGTKEVFGDRIVLEIMGMIRKYVFGALGNEYDATIELSLYARVLPNITLHAALHGEKKAKSSFTLHPKFSIKKKK